MSSIKKNLSYNIIYQILTIVLPLITAPYISRVIGVDGVGTNSYVYSIASYFMLFCILGLNNYGNREISRCRDDFERRSRTFWEIYFMQLCLSAVVIAVFFLFLFTLMPEEYRFFELLCSLYLFGAMIDINWFFFGMEQFKTTVIRNCVIKLLTFVLTFVIVRQASDLWKYMLLLSFSSLVTQIVLWFFLKRHVVFVRPSVRNVIRHIKPNFILFLPVLAISLYQIMDKIMLGFISGTVQTGLYESANRIIQMPGLVFTALGTVMLPRVSNLVAKNEYEAANAYVRDSMQFSMFLSSGMAFGIMAIASGFIPFFYGKGYEESILLLECLTPVLVISSWKSVLRTQCLIPRGLDRSYIISVALGAVINLIINGLLIPRIGSFGAVIGTLSAELLVCIYQSYAVKAILPLRVYVKDNWSFLVSGLIMCLALMPVKQLVGNHIWGMFVLIFVGGLIYCAASCVMLALTNKERFQRYYGMLIGSIRK